ncbi:MAG: virulence RhuM family protein [Clostridia bacterium]
MDNTLLENNNDIIIYTTDDGQVKIEVRLEDENVWLTQNAMAELFDTTKQNISLHIKNIFEEKELDENLVVKENLTTASDGKNYKTKFYNLDLIISVGYRVKSIRGTQFRIWANKLIKEYIIKGYNLNVDRFKNNGGGVYFEEVLEKIRDIRSSEKVFWRKILDIYATSIDYDARDEQTKEFFKTVQNKMHFAVHGNTAAEVIFNRVDSEKENIGLTNFKGNMPTKSETEIAKNYLSEKELDMLNRMVSAYLDVAEINALNMHPMTMKNWIRELDGFLTMILKN